MKPSRLIVFLLFVLVSTCFNAQEVVAQQREDTSESPKYLTGEALVSQRAERIAELFDRLIQAYQEGNKDQQEKLLRELEGYINRQETSFTKEELNKMEEIAQRPVVKIFIDEFYAARRASDVEKARYLNNYAGYLYQNPMLQDYVNQLGQSLVPKGSERFFAFRIAYDPRPDAFVLTTGSVYVTTGLLAMLDNEAQLAYILGHEIGHVERRHAFARERGRVLEALLDADQIRSARRKAFWIGAIAAGVGAVAGAKAGGAQGAMMGASLGAVGTAMVANLMESMRKPKFTEWSDVQEKDADEFAARAALSRSFDVREAPKVFVTLESAIRGDDRVGLAFHYGNTSRLAERRQYIQTVLTGALKAELDQKAAAGLQAASPNFNLLMASLKRDNGMLAIEYDLFDMARRNLEEAVAIRSTDPRAHYYLGRVYKLTARNNEEEQKAIDHFLQSIKLDAARGSYPFPHLEQALALLKKNDRSLMPEAQKEIKAYIEGFKLTNGGRLPDNMLILYDYLSLTGDDSWSIPPVTHTGTPVRSDAPALIPVAAKPGN
jgi:predicted Zn-dependent protease